MTSQDFNNEAQAADLFRGLNGMYILYLHYLQSPREPQVPTSSLRKPPLFKGVRNGAPQALADISLQEVAREKMPYGASEAESFPEVTSLLLGDSSVHLPFGSCGWCSPRSLLRPTESTLPT